jgi:hypothetical protein
MENEKGIESVKSHAGNMYHRRRIVEALRKIEKLEAELRVWEEKSNRS